MGLVEHLAGLGARTRLERDRALQNLEAALKLQGAAHEPIYGPSLP